jgi:hypothetical protein
LGSIIGNELSPQVRRILITKRRTLLRLAGPIFDEQTRKGVLLKHWMVHHYSMARRSGKYTFEMGLSNRVGMLMHYSRASGQYWKWHPYFTSKEFPHLTALAYPAVRPVRYRFSMLPRGVFSEHYRLNLHKHSMTVALDSKLMMRPRGRRDPIFYDPRKYRFKFAKTVESWGELNAPFLDFAHRAPLRISFSNRLLSARFGDYFLSAQMPAVTAAEAYETGIIVLLYRFQENLAPVLSVFSAFLAAIFEFFPAPWALAMEPDWSFLTLFF